MTMMADFLLQPASAKRPAAATGNAVANAVPPRMPSGGQDFSRLLVQQRQAADIKPPTPPRERPQSQQPDATGGSRQPVDDRRHAAETKAADQRTEPGAGVEQGRQKDDSRLREAVEDDKTVTGDEDAEADAEASAVPGLPDPLLQQILLAQESSGQHAAQAMPAETGLSGEQAVNGLLGMIQGEGRGNTGAAALVQPDSRSASEAGRSAAVTAAVTTAGLAEEAETAGTDGSPELSSGLSTDKLLEAGPLLAGSMARAERATSNGASQSIQPERVPGAGEARADTLMRSEAVQSAQAARQVQGQPLNMQQPGWSKELTDKVMWMSSQNLKSAEIKLNPAELGRLDIRVQIGQEHAQITFTSAHAGVRDSLDGQMHRLRELLEQQGMHNVDVEVADQSRQQQRHAGNGSSGVAGEAMAEDEQLVAVSDVEQQEQGHAGLVSYYV